MVFKPFTHIARQSFTKAFTHGYAQSVVAASQSSYASSTTLNHLTATNPAKFSRTTQLQHVFQPSSSSGAGAKASQGSSGGGDVGLAAYYAAWQQAQQTGDDSDWKQLQLKRKLGWKPSTEEESAKQKSEDNLPSTARSDLNHSPHITKASANADVSAKVEEAVAREIQIQEEQAQAEEASEAQDASATEAFPDLPADVAAVGDITKEGSLLASERIVQLASAGKFAEIPGAFAALLRDGLTPTVGAYNALLDSAIKLHDDRSQAIPKALDIYSDMLRRRVIPDEQTYQMLVQLFVLRARDAMTAMEVLEQERIRFGGMEEPGKFMLHSSELEKAILSEDDSLGIALKLFDTATARHAELVFPLDIYRYLITACATKGMVEAMIRVYAHMESHKVTPHASIFPSMIDAFASSGDLTSAVECYNEYRSLAVSDDNGTFCIIHRLDGQVYAALIKAYMSCGKEENAMRFFERIRSSFDGVTENRETRQETLESVIVHDALVQHALNAGDFARALEQAKTRLRDGALDQAMSQICMAAADSGELKIASEAYDTLPHDVETRLKPAVSMLALHIREGNVPAAQPLWLMLSSVGQATSDMVQPTVMYAVALLKSGRTDESLVEARNMFARIRSASPNPSSDSVQEQINESIHLLSRVLVQSAAVLSPQASMSLLWLMTENGGIIPPVAEHAVAFLGPLEISQLSPHDLALALQVQAGILVNHSAMSFDAAHPIRFSHMLDIALANGLAMDSTTVNIVDQAVNKLFTSRPDMVGRWHSYLGLASSPATYFSDPRTPVSELSSTSSVPSEDSFDPYAYATDFKGSAMIAEELESTHGRPESHLNGSLDRLRNMRRGGRHPRYITYAKLISAAAKNNRVDLVHEVLSMARRDVPLLPQYKAVKYGWTSILDAMVAACLTLGDRGLAAKYHNELSELGSAPSANTFGLYITTLKESTKTFDEATEALKIFHRAVAEGVEPTSFLYNALIGKLGKARRIDDCLQYFAEMRANNVRPTSVTYGTIVNALCRVSDERFAEEMFEEMESMPNYKPRPAPYNSMIQYFLNTKRDRSKVLAYYERMLSRNIKPTMHTYKLLIDAHASLEPVDMEAAEKVLETIKASKQEPEAVHYASLIHANGCVMQDMEAALNVFNSAVSNPKVQVQPCLYQALLESMVANNQVAQSEAIVRDMTKRRVEMTAYIANTLIHGWAAEGNLQKASAIYNSIGIDKREPSTYEAMTRAFLAADDRASASRTVQEMLSRGYPSAVAHKIADLIGNASQHFHHCILLYTSIGLFCRPSMSNFRLPLSTNPLYRCIFVRHNSHSASFSRSAMDSTNPQQKRPKKLIFAPGDIEPTPETQTPKSDVLVPASALPPRLVAEALRSHAMTPKTALDNKVLSHPARAHQFVRNPPLTISQLHPNNPLYQFHAWFRDPRLDPSSAPETCTLATASLPSGRVSARVVYLKELDERGWTVYSNWGSREGKGGHVFGPLTDGNAEGSVPNPMPGSEVDESLVKDLGLEQQGNKWAALTFCWSALERQVRIEGMVEPLSREESEMYWRTRERGSQIGAWASWQSKVLWAAEPDTLVNRRRKSFGPGEDSKDAIVYPVIPHDVDETDIDDGRALLEKKVREMEARFADTKEIPLPPFWGGVRLIPESVEFWQGRRSRLHDRFRYVRIHGTDESSYKWRIERLSP
ncbi:pentatricopeptide repeat protein [Aspergillus lucknowensis]|uniref:Pyridoxine 5'-phosphate oxidase dimerisation C-terminal domain-containing protein n=1 Tax=Aspergillus lucknowensis TaxID=176173 RepID=A0ABR4LMD4_9EURO